MLFFGGRRDGSNCPLGELLRTLWMTRARKKQAKTRVGQLMLECLVSRYRKVVVVEALRGVKQLGKLARQRV